MGTFQESCKFWADHRYALRRSSLQVKLHVLWGLVFSAGVGAAFGRAVTCMGLWHPPAVQLRQICVFGRHFHTHTAGVLVHKYISISYVAVFLWTDPVSHWSEWDVGKAYKATHGSTNLHEYVLVFEADYCSQQIAAFFYLLLHFSVWKHCICFASLKSSLAMQETHLCQCSIQPQHLRKQMASNGDWWCSALRWEVFWVSPTSCGLSSCSPLHPQCVLHLPQLCRDNLHSPSSLAATPSCPWAKKSPYCSKEHMQQSLMLTLIVPIQTTQ